jgi:hypothetical protein
LATATNSNSTEETPNTSPPSSAPWAGTSLTVAGELGCLQLRNCDCAVDAVLFSALLETAAQQVSANKYRHRRHRR